MGFCRAIDDLPRWAKVILALPVLDVIWAIYRIVKGACKNHIVTLVVGIIWLVGACTFTWLLDLIFIILNGKPLFAD